MSEQNYDFTLVGQFLHYVTRTTENEIRMVWECRWCYALTNQPEKHYAVVHDNEETFGWVRLDELKVER